jgi:N6-L-threonylcarbamoyladenine synthase
MGMTLDSQNRPGSGLILGIESSCDETAAAVVRGGEQVLSSVVSSQAALHAAYGGVVPEIASREHLRHIVPVVRAAVAEAGVSLNDLEAIAVTEGPGLAGALLVGILYAKSLAFGLAKPLIAVNHLEGHIHAVVMEARRAGTLPAEFPLLALVVSGGHTHLYLASESAATGAWSYRNVGRTVDDAAGEAFDKVAKLLGLGYPGGPWIDELARHGSPQAVVFQFHGIKPRAFSEDGLRFDFSFSGIKTAVLRYVQTHSLGAAIEKRRSLLAATPERKPAEAVELLDRQTLDLIASFQAAVVGNLIRQTLAAAEAFDVRGLLISGGVAANRELRQRLTDEAAQRGLPVSFPSLALATDNAAMIAAAAWPKLVNGEIAPEAMSANPQLRLG